MCIIYCCGSEVVRVAMKKLKPRLIIADNDRRKSGVFKYILLIFIFLAGFCSGYFTRENKLAERYLTNTIDTVSLHKTINDNLSNLKSYYNNFSNIQDYKISPDNKNSTYELSKRNTSLEENDNNITERSPGNKVKFELIKSQNNINYTDQKYTLQIAAFETEKKTHGVVSDLIDKGYDAYSTVSVNSRGDKWHLVRIGMYNSYDEAIEKSEDLYKTDGINSEIEILEPPAVTKLSNFDLE